jgi:cyclopropane fatty-acyl-phospholipid synthase-like methyltransferase
VGCGRGVTTIKLAEWTNGNIIGIDIDNTSLDAFRKKIKARGLGHRLKAINSSFIGNPFEVNSFDMIWAEGVFHIIGYDKCLKESYGLLIQNGFLVIVDTLIMLEKHQELFRKRGFKVYDQINWAENAWWTEYYGPLEAKLKELRQTPVDPSLYLHLTRHEQEVSMVKHNPKAFDCAHLILQKIRYKNQRKKN